MFKGGRLEKAREKRKASFPSLSPGCLGYNFTNDLRLIQLLIHDASLGIMAFWTQENDDNKTVNSARVSTTSY